MTASTSAQSQMRFTKVPEVTLVFWILKIAATTLGETGGDWVSMSLGLGYAVGSGIFAILFAAAVTAQVSSPRFHAYLYWFVIVATTMLGTTIADFADRALGLGYPGGAALIAFALAASLAIWLWFEGDVSVGSVSTPRVEAFYWITILFSQTLGTALGDWVAGEDRGGLGLGYEETALIFSGALFVVAIASRFARISRTLLFWTAFVLTRPLGAALGDLMDKPVSEGGLAFSRLFASAMLVIFILVCILVVPQRAARHLEHRHVG